MASFKGKYAPLPGRGYINRCYLGEKFERRAEKTGETGKKQEERGDVKWKMDVRSVLENAKGVKITATCA